MSLDDGSITCFDNEQEMVNFNKAPSAWSGYSNDAFSVTGMTGLFADDVPGRFVMQQRCERLLSVLDFFQKSAWS